MRCSIDVHGVRDEKQLKEPCCVNLIDIFQIYLFSLFDAVYLKRSEIL